LREVAFFIFFLTLKSLEHGQPALGLDAV